MNKTRKLDKIQVIINQHTHGLLTDSEALVLIRRETIKPEKKTFIYHHKTPFLDATIDYRAYTREHAVDHIANHTVWGEGKTEEEIDKNLEERGENSDAVKQDLEDIDELLKELLEGLWEKM